MKKVLSIIAIAILFIATSCSKEAKLNKDLNGEWNLISVNSQVINPLFSGIILKFEKTHKGTGKFTQIYTETKSGISNIKTTNGTYSLSKDNIITLIDDTGYVEKYNVTSYDKTNLTYTQDGLIACYKKK